MKRNEKSKKIDWKENKRKKKGLGLGLSIVWELNLKVLEFGIALMFDFDVFPHCSSISFGSF